MPSIGLSLSQDPRAVSRASLWTAGAWDRYDTGAGGLEAVAEVRAGTLWTRRHIRDLTQFPTSTQY